MSRIQVGRASVLIAEGAQRSVQTQTFDGDERSGHEIPAVVAGPSTLLEVAHHNWDEAGQVLALSRGDSSPAFDRLLHGVRLGIKALEDGAEYCEFGLLSWDRSRGWGNIRNAALDEIESLLGRDLGPLMVESGAYSCGTRARLIADTSNRRNRLCAVFPAGSAVTPLVVYAITRVLPILVSEGRAER